MENLHINVMSLSEQAKDKIRQYISTMDLEKSNKLPREETMANLIGVSRITLRTALNDLACEGIILRRQGKGTFVNVDSLNINVKFNPVMEFTDMIRNSGYRPSVQLLEIQFVSAKSIAAELQLSENDKLVMCEKIFFADENLCAYCIDYFPLTAIGGEEAFDNFSNYQNSVFTYIYGHSGHKIIWDKVKIKTAIGEDIPNLSSRISDKNINNKPFLLLEGVNYDDHDTPLVYAKEYVDTDFIQFSMIRQRNINYSK
ncbi:GntR family transcriptional regulator [Anaerocolumna sp.]|uniref:GntR family transcriptional regulator n=1 Tax=Anaerocolumna sp. TaxID=2041569 RepID=UPI0028AEBD7E|nr:GntR family transcriptional regulator [Anaerocolumna sp.]